MKRYYVIFKNLSFHVVKERKMKKKRCYGCKKGICKYCWFWIDFLIKINGQIR
jgi:hypothetical protein